MSAADSRSGGYQVRQVKLLVAMLPRVKVYHPRYQRALQPYLKKLQAINTDSGSAPDQPVALKIGERKLRLSPWEKARIAEFFDKEAGDTDWSVLVAHGSALIAKAMVDVERLRRDPTSSVFYALQAELMLDSAIGAALMKEIRELVELCGKTLEADKGAAIGAGTN